MESRKHIFTPTEKKYFLEIIKKYKAVVENKETDSATLRKKNVTWNKIAAEYNASPHASTQATTKQLRRLWMNIKQRQREALTKERRQRMTTGAGPSISDVAEVVPANSDAVLETVMHKNCTTQDHMVQPLYIEEMPAAAPLDLVQVVIETPPQASRPASVSETSPTLPERRPTALTGEHLKDSILEREYQDRKIRAKQKHDLELAILKQQLCEAKAKAELAVLSLRQRQHVPQI